MTTKELRQQIEKVLGNSIRCLLPSYWWKKLFHQVADRIDEVEQKMDNLPDGIPIVSSIAELESLNLNKGRVASVVGGMGFSQCYQPTDEELSNTLAELFPKLTRVKSIELKNNPLEELEAGIAYLVGVEGTKTSDLIIVCLKQDGLTLMYAVGNSYGLTEGIMLSPGTIAGLNKILAENDLRFVTANPDGIFGEGTEASLAALDKKFAINIDIDVYVKGLTWERFLKEGEEVGNTDGIPSIYFADFYDNDDNYGFTTAGWEKMKTMITTSSPEAPIDNLQTTVEEYFASNIRLYNNIVRRSLDKAEGFIAYIDQGKFLSEFYQLATDFSINMGGKWLVMVNVGGPATSTEVYLSPIYGNSETLLSLFGENFRVLKLKSTGEVEVVCRTPFKLCINGTSSYTKYVNKQFVKYWFEASNMDGDLVGVLPIEKISLAYADGARLLSAKFEATKFVGTYFDGTSLMEITIDGTTGEGTSKNVGTLLTTKVEFEEFTTKAELEDSEKVTAAALNDLNARLIEVVNRLDALGNN